ncbi:MAG: quinolinate synthase NadA [Promethearchaeota archaeon]
MASSSSVLGTVMEPENNTQVKILQSEIEKLKEETNTIILAHLYQTLDVQDVGDFVGDSLGLSRKAAGVKNAENIIFAAVDFMAEVAKILNPSKRVLLPDTSASCPMANQLKAHTIREYKKKNPGVPVVLYVNTLAEAKAESDVICTSANSVEICSALAEVKGTNELLIGPDRNLAHFIREQTGLKIITMPEKGCCHVHDQFLVEDVNLQKQLHPHAILVVHPECRPEVQDAAEHVGSTSQMIRYVAESNEKEFIIGTERGLVDKLNRDHPDKQFYPLAATTTGGICKNMKKNNLNNIRELLVKIKDGKCSTNEVTINPSISGKAKQSIDFMFKLMER